MGEVAIKTLLEVQMNELQSKYSLLRLEYPEDGSPSVQGILRFHADYCGKEAQGEYDIRISIPDDYPHSVPTAYETGGRLPQDFHRYATDMHLCLGAPVAVRKTFLASPTLLCFVEKLIIPHLFSHAYFVNHGEMPFGELKHGVPGIIEFYNEFFDTNLPVTMKLLKILADSRKRSKSYLPCPCQTGKPLYQCHGPQVEELWGIMPPQHFASELKGIVAYCMKACPDIDYTCYLPHKTLKKQNSKLRKAKPR